MELATEQRTSVAYDIARPKAAKPPMHEVIVFNDDFTPMEFVVEVLQKVFSKDEQSATKIMLQVHYQGQGVCGYYPKDIAETKAAHVVSLAQENGYPLFCEAKAKR